MKHMIIPVLLVFFTAGLVLGQDAVNNTSAENVTIPENITAPENVSVPENATAPENVTVPETVAVPENVTEAQPKEAAAPNLQYIWSVTGIEDGQVTMVLNQNGEELIGQAKYEPEIGEPWNADVVGSVSGDKVQLVLTALKGETMATTKMTGTFANEIISGNFTQISQGKVSKSGEFSAMWINPDVSSYTPAVIAEPEEPETQPAQANNATTPAVTAGETTQQPVQLGQSSRFVDVRKYKDQIGPGGDLSGIPPGMGGSGLN
ncbi:MAG: hypothetical protein QUS09_10500 [Methanotrichaceae archaeon]|nr:hypothetical protein [Methanotrichaceae archaeon]